jgi:hypothetical protein
MLLGVFLQFPVWIGFRGFHESMIAESESPVDIF